MVLFLLLRNKQKYLPKYEVSQITLLKVYLFIIHRLKTTSKSLYFKFTYSLLSINIPKHVMILKSLNCQWK